MIYIYTKNGKCVARKAEIMNAKRWRVWIGECWNVLFIWGNYGWPSCTAREMLIHDSGWVSFSICRDWSGCIGVMYTSVVMKVLMPAWTRIWACNSACWHLCPLVIANLLNWISSFMDTFLVCPSHCHGWYSGLFLNVPWRQSSSLHSVTSLWGLGACPAMHCGDTSLLF